MILESERLHLREPEPGDVELLRAYYRRNALRFAPWGESRNDDAAEHAAWIAARHAERRDGAPVGFLCFERDGAALTAIVMLTGFSVAPSSAMISYTVDGSVEGSGVASEAVRAVLGHAFGTLDLASVSAHYDPENARSERLLQRLGFREVARIPPLALPHLRQRGQVMTVLERSAR